MISSFDSLLSEERAGTLHFGGVRMALLDIEAGFWGLRCQMEALAGKRLTDVMLQRAGADGGASFARAFAGHELGSDGAQALRDCVAAYQAAGFGRFELEVLHWPFDCAHRTGSGTPQDTLSGRVVVRGYDTFEAWMVRQHRQQSESPVCAYSAGVLVGFVNVLAGRQDVVCVERACQAQGADACLFELLPADAAGDAPVVAFAPDPALGRQLNLLEILFDRMPMGIAIFDRGYYLRRCNPTWTDFATRYAPPSASRVAPGVYYFDLLPGSESIVVPLFERVLAGETIRQESVRLESGGVVTHWDMVLAPLFGDCEVTGILNATVDATERVQAHQELGRTVEALRESQQLLEQRVQERTHEISTLLEVSRNMASTLELEPLLGVILDQLKAVVDYTGAAVLALEGDVLTILAHRGPIPQEEASQLSFLLEGAQVNREVIRRREPVIIPDVRGDTPLARAFRQSAGERLEITYGYIRSWLGVPLMVKDQVIGMLTLDHGEPNYYSPQQAELALAFANQAALAIENARLYEQAQELAVVEERSRLARDLHDAVTQTLFSASLIAEVLPRLWERNPDEGLRRLKELRELTRGALAEMRTLLLELRPTALEEANLADLLRQLAESITGRARVPVVLEVEGECDLPVEVKVALYRIAHEALNNMAKHAGASRATVGLHCFPPDVGGERGGAGVVELRISDDGTGFDPESIAPESLGLGIMRERAEAIGATLTVESEIGRGTELTVEWRA